MSTEYAITFEHVSKVYNRKPSGNLRYALEEFLARRKAAREQSSGSFRALDDVSFAVERGEALGIIGPNGAGKSTILKLLAGITRPVEGRIEVVGRVASLIEVGAGFHADLTGRENVFLNGAIMGMTRAEIARKLESIIAFAELEEFMDLPVKRYSSGMYMRLGFSVAAHLEPDIMLVDEVLAVGDRSFQIKSVRRMHEIVRSGRTVVFISHDLNAVQGLCDRVIYVNHGRIVSSGDPTQTINRYLDDVDSADKVAMKTEEFSNQEMEIVRIVCRREDGSETDEFVTGQPLIIDLEYQTNKPVTRPVFIVGISDGRGGNLTLASMHVDRAIPDLVDGLGVMRIRFDTLALLPRAYQIYCAVASDLGSGDIAPWRVRGLFRVVDTDRGYVRQGDDSSVWHLRGDAPVYMPYQWQHLGSADAVATGGLPR